MGGGVPYVVLGASFRDHHVPYVDGMRIGPKRGEVSYPGAFQPVGTWADILSRRNRLLAKARRQWTAEHRGEYVSPQVNPFYWDHRQGGYSAYQGTVPEAFKPDSHYGLSARRKK